jgi:RND family efflux transporter MFP subunit
MLKKWYAPSAVLAAAALAASCSGQSEDSSAQFRQRNQALPAVEAVEVMYGSFPLEERLSGSVRARNQTEIYAEAAGTIEAVYVDDGDRVAAGDPLVQLRARDFEERVRQAESGLQVAEARVRQTEANLTRTEASLERVQAIVERQLGTRAELDTAQADAASARADLDLMRAQRDQAASVLEERGADLADTLVRAPIDGVVGGRNAEVGQQANTGAPLFVIGDVSNMQVDITLTQHMLGYIQTGTPVNIYSDTAADEIIQATVTRISPYLHPVTHTTRAEIVIDEPGSALTLRPGMFVTVDVLYGQSQQAPLVPNSAIYRHPRDGREGVFVTSLEAALRNPEGGSAYVPPDEQSFEDPVGPISVRFAPVDVVARGRASSGVTGVNIGDWVVTIGHHLLVNSNSDQAIVQPTPWDHILDLQQMESGDLLDVIAAKQRANEARRVNTE